MKAAIAAAFTQAGRSDRQQGPWLFQHLDRRRRAGRSDERDARGRSSARRASSWRWLATKLLPPAIFGAVHPRFKTPHISTALTGLVICVAAAFTPIADLEKMVNIGTLFAFVIVCVTVLILRFQNPDMPRPFRCPLIYIIAPAGILVNVSMMLFLPVSTWIRLIAMDGSRHGFYFAYGFRHSILGKDLVTERFDARNRTDRRAVEVVSPTATTSATRNK